MKRCIFAIILGLSIAACGGGSESTTSDAVGPAINETRIFAEDFIRQPDAEQVFRKTFGVDFVSKTLLVNVRRSVDVSKEGFEDMRGVMKHLKKSTQKQGDDVRLWSKKYAIAIYIYILNKDPYYFRLPFKRDFIPIKKIDEEEIKFAKRIIVLFRKDKNGEYPSSKGLRYFEENDPAFSKGEGNARGWYSTSGNSWRLLDSNHLDAQAHWVWLQKSENIIHSLAYFKADELKLIEDYQKNLASGAESSSGQ